MLVAWWIDTAKKYIGLREIHGAPTAPLIASWLQRLGAWWRDDETPWCGTFIAAVMQESSLKIPAAWYRAKEWASYGVGLSAPTLGCIAVLERPGGGHVGIVVGKDANGNLMVLGGNQGDAVSIVPISPSRAIAYRWPSGVPSALIALPVIASTAQASKNEA